MRALLAPALLLGVVTFTACTEGGPLDPLPVTAALEPDISAKPSTHPLPLAGSCEITSTQVLAFAPPILHALGTAVCQVSHLGRVTIHTMQHVNIATGQQVAESTWTTANGDLLYSTAVGVSAPTGPTTIRFSGITTIVGGTGRFADARGQLSAGGTVDNVTGTGLLTYEGYIVYNAWQRSN